MYYAERMNIRQSLCQFACHPDALLFVRTGSKPFVKCAAINILHDDSLTDILNIFPGKDKALLTIENLQSSTDKKLLIVKDHSAEPVIGYLIPHYTEVFVADVSLYSGSLADYINENEITDILFINGIDSANNALYCQRMRDLFDNSLSD